MHSGEPVTAGHKIIINRSLWRNFPTIRCERWVADNMVLIGDAKATAHFSIGSGTKLAMEDAIALDNQRIADVMNVCAQAGIQGVTFASLTEWSGTVGDLLDRLFDPSMTLADLGSRAQSRHLMPTAACNTGDP